MSIPRSSLVNRGRVPRQRLMRGRVSELVGVGGSPTLGALTLSSAGTVDVIGASAITLSAATLSSAGVAVTRDGPGNWFVPKTAAEFAVLGLAAPDYLWTCQETSGNLSNAIGSSLPLVANATGHLYAQTITGWTRTFVGTDGVTTDQSWRTSSALLDMASGESWAMVALGSVTVPVTTARAFMTLDPSERLLFNVSSAKAVLRSFHGGVAVQGTVDHAPLTTVRQLVWYRNATTDVSGAMSNVSAVVGTHNESARSGGVKGLGQVGTAACAEARYGWFAIFKGANAERDWSAYLTTMRG